MRNMLEYKRKCIVWREYSRDGFDVHEIIWRLDQEVMTFHFK